MHVSVLCVTFNLAHHLGARDPRLAAVRAQGGSVECGGCAVRVPGRPCPIQGQQLYRAQQRDQEDVRRTPYAAWDLGWAGRLAQVRFRLGAPGGLVLAEIYT